MKAAGSRARRRKGRAFVGEHVDLLSSVGISISVAAGLAFVGNWLRQPGVLKAMLSEYLKYSLAHIRAFAGARSWSGLRGDMASLSGG